MLIEGTQEITQETNQGAATPSNTTVTHRVTNKSTTPGDNVALGFQSHEGDNSLRAKITGGLSGAGGLRGFLALSTRNSAGTMVEGFRVDDTQIGTMPGPLKLTTAGSGLFIKEGANACMGLATLVAGVAVVSTTKVTANSRIFLTRQSIGGTLGTSVDITARTPGTSFTITAQGSVLDTSTVGWEIKEPA